MIYPEKKREREKWRCRFDDHK